MKTRITLISITSAPTPRGPTCPSSQSKRIKKTASATKSWSMGRVPWSTARISLCPAARRCGLRQNAEVTVDEASRLPLKIPKKIVFPNIQTTTTALNALARVNKSFDADHIAEITEEADAVALRWLGAGSTVLT
jgi:hypothetical protein